MPKAPQDVLIPSIYFSRKYKSTDITKKKAVMSNVNNTPIPPPLGLTAGSGVHFAEERCEVATEPYHPRHFNNILSSGIPPSVDEWNAMREFIMDLQSKHDVLLAVAVVQDVHYGQMKSQLYHKNQQQRKKSNKEKLFYTKEGREYTGDVFYQAALDDEANARHEALEKERKKVEREEMKKRREDYNNWREEEKRERELRKKRKLAQWEKDKAKAKQLNLAIPKRPPLREPRAKTPEHLSLPKRSRRANIEEVEEAEVAELDDDDEGSKGCGAGQGQVGVTSGRSRYNGASLLGGFSRDRHNQKF
ncbi:hypothetical protein CPB86DRAFT_801370 [Serendipita vermifera]|nr:hypothetical protein CPB86DRAFT_801370 [Serendipita vermifera]